MGEKKRKAKAKVGYGLRMHMPNLSLEQRQAHTDAANAAMNASIADGVEPNTWLREQFTRDLVWGVWQDAAEPGSVGIGILKGYGRVMLISQGKRGRPITSASIRCTCIEEAEAMCLTYGDGRTSAEASDASAGTAKRRTPERDVKPR